MTARPKNTPMSGLDRSIQLMQLLGDQADAIWSLLDPADAQRLRTAMSTGAEHTLGTAIEDDFWSSLSAEDISVISRLLERESPQIAAITLSKLQPVHAAILVKSLSERRAAAALHRLAHLGTVKDAVIHALEQAYKRQIEVAGPARSGGQAELVAEILDGVGGDRELKLLVALEKKEKGLRHRISQHMFRFEDLVHLAPAGIQTLLSRLDRVLLVTALKGAPEAVRTQLLQNMTRRAADLLTAEIEATSPNEDSIEAAQREIVRTIRILTKQNEILIDRTAERALVA